MVDVVIRFDGDKPERIIRNVSLVMHPSGNWFDLINKKGEIISVSIRAYSLQEVVPEKIQTKKDGTVIDNGIRVTDKFNSVEIIRPPIKNKYPRCC